MNAKDLPFFQRESQTLYTPHTESSYQRALCSVILTQFTCHLTTLCLRAKLNNTDVDITIFSH